MGRAGSFPAMKIDEAEQQILRRAGSVALEFNAPMFSALADLGTSAAVVGDGIWVAVPDRTNIDRFGDQPPGLDAIETLATAAGCS